MRGRGFHIVLWLFLAAKSSIGISKKKGGIPMKKLVSLALALTLSLNLLAFVPVAPIEPQDPDPTPVITLMPTEPEKPGQPPAEPQDDLPPEANVVREG